jgi:hypothetical protein
MELPLYLKNLYRHWEHHTQNRDLVKYDSFTISSIELFASERMRIWKNKEQKASAPYTSDPILRDYRFCNIYRELDKQTIAFHQLLNPYRHDFQTWLLNIMYARFLCSPDTLKLTGLLSLDTNKNHSVYSKLINSPRPRFGSAYVFPVSLILKSNYKTREEFFCFYLPTVAQKCAQTIQSWEKVSVSKGLSEILPIFGFNFKFHWTEILIDIAYQYPQYIDLYKQFPIGPGSQPNNDKNRLKPRSRSHLSKINKFKIE